NRGTKAERQPRRLRSGRPEVLHDPPRAGVRNPGCGSLLIGDHELVIRNSADTALQRRAILQTNFDWFIKAKLLDFMFHLREPRRVFPTLRERRSSAKKIDCHRRQDQAPKSSSSGPLFANSGRETLD